MSFLEENPGVTMDSEDQERDDPQCCSEDPARDALELGPSLTSVSSAHSKTFFVLASHVGSPCEKKGSPIFLAVSKGELCLCCEKNKGQLHPSLLLKKKNLSDLAAQKEPACPPFTFYRAKVGSKNTLESAAHPGWFVCTSCNAWEPVGMTNTRGRKKHTEFSFHPVCKAEMSPSEVSECAAAPSDAFLSLTP
ncbi:Interleukin-37 [Camelus dromedarius]|uniref:Interleukin-1 n=1 Tax=Camelus dromedarius TaxID=9838 RepID=A0A5N4CDC3_CAMDR|nr:Interleukin-37 [Camelus dromedarius]